jgi:hypothetical protein
VTSALGKASFDGPECIKEVKLLYHNMIICFMEASVTDNLDMMLA